jgi:hypothetical protein
MTADTPASSEECNCFAAVRAAARHVPNLGQGCKGCLTILHKESAILIDPGLRGYALTPGKGAPRERAGPKSF